MTQLEAEMKLKEKDISEWNLIDKIEFLKHIEQFHMNCDNEDSICTFPYNCEVCSGANLRLCDVAEKINYSCCTKPRKGEKPYVLKPEAEGINMDMVIMCENCGGCGDW